MRSQPIRPTSAAIRKGFLAWLDMCEGSLVPAAAPVQCFANRKDVLMKVNPALQGTTDEKGRRQHSSRALGFVERIGTASCASG